MNNQINKEYMNLRRKIIFLNEIIKNYIFSLKSRLDYFNDFYGKNSINLPKKRQQIFSNIFETEFSYEFNFNNNQLNNFDKFISPIRIE